MTLRRLKHRLRFIAWPSYECEYCVGQDWGCYCAHHGAVAPGGPGPERWRLALRKLLSAVGWGWPSYEDVKD